MPESRNPFVPSWQVVPAFGLVACRGSANIPFPVISRRVHLGFRTG
jgi:hypothetical protein